MNISQLDIPGCFIVKPNVAQDKRGSFVKVYNESCYRDLGIEFDFKEEFFSLSNLGVIRGMHFQAPPHDHNKIVYCPKGAIFDVFLDLRIGSPTYLQCHSCQLSEVNGFVLYLAKGIAHGFCSLVDGAIVVYKTSSEYEKNYDMGVLWNSCGIDWPSIANDSTVSVRDRSFPILSEFESPFVFR